MTEARTEELPVWNLTLAEKGRTEVKFDKAKSVFKPWIKDSQSTLKQALNFDLGCWKVPKLIKDEEELHLVTATISRHFEALKQIYTTLISSDSYPAIGVNEFTAFCRVAQILDHTVPTATVDRMFIAAKVAAPAAISQNALVRFEFLEVLVRIANAKYKETGRAETFNEALNMLLDSIWTNYPMKQWQEFRERYLWCNTIDNVYKTNAAALQDIHNKLFPRYGANGCSDCVALIANETPALGLSAKDVAFCFGMSKMTVKDEVGSQSEYQKLRFVEFLEFLARVADSAYKHEFNMDLGDKVQRTLDEVFPAYGHKRIDVGDDSGAGESTDESVFVDIEAIEDAERARDQFDDEEALLL